MKSSSINSSSNNNSIVPWVFFQEWKAAALIFAGSILLRVIYLLSLGDDPWLHYPIVDEVIYQDMAIALMKDPYSLFPFFRPPLFPAILAVWYGVVGVGDSFIDVRLLNAFLGSVSIVLAYFIVLRFFNRKVAIISSAISSTAGILVHLHTTGLTTSAFMLLFLGSILLMITSFDRDNSSSIIYAVLAGLLLGLSALGRPVSLIPAGMVIIWIMFFKDMRISHRVIGISSMGLGILLAILPVSILNATHGDYVLISNNGGVNFYLGNNVESLGYSAAHPELGPGWSIAGAEEYASQAAGRTLKPSEASSWYYREGVRNWTEHPTEMTGLWLKKVALLLGGTEISNNGDLNFFAAHRPLLRLLLINGFWWIFPLSLVGIGLTWRSQNRSFLVLIIGSYLLTVSAFFITSRFRAPILPLLVPFAVDYIIIVINNSIKRTTLITSLIVSIVLLIGLNTASKHYGPEPVRAYGHLIQAILYKDSGQPEKAAEHFWLALQNNSDSPTANYNLGEIERKRGNYQVAVEYYLRENEIRPQYQNYRGLGICYREMGLHEKAVEALNQAHIMNPEDQNMRLAYAEEIGELALTSFEQQEWTLAAERFLEAQNIAPDNPFFTFGYAGAIWAMGDSGKADSLIIDLQSKYPDFVPAQQWVEEKWRPLDQ